MSKLFNQVSMRKPGRNVFDLSHERKFSFNMGELIPIFCEEVIPGDTFKMNTEVLMRLAPMVAPIMHRVNVFTHFFYVPNRLVWDNWSKFITGGETYDPNNPASVPVFPTIDILRDEDALIGRGQLADYLGVPNQIPGAPIGVDCRIKLNALPFRAYQLIYNEYYRDQNLQAPLALTKTDGIVSTGEKEILVMKRKRNWEKDYFTSALPWTQKGGEVSIPLSGEVPVSLADPYTANTVKLVDSTGDPSTDGDLNVSSGALRDASTSAAWIDPDGSLITNLEDANAAITVNELRRSIKLQEWLEKNARAGSRYIEQILSHFGVVSSDARLQRPEYLGGGKNPVVISEVLQNSATDTTPQGNMAGHGISAGNQNGFKKFFEEHGYVIGIISVLPRTAYQNGIRRHLLKDDKFDFFWPEFAHLGEQPVYNSEVWLQANIEDDPNNGKNSEFGYQSRYAEYKFIPSSVHGDFAKFTGGLDKWHMGRMFDSPPMLNDTFISSEDVTHRIFAVTDPSYHKLYCQIYNNVKAIRPMPQFGTPSF